MSNLDFWNEVGKTDPDTTKKTNNGKYEFTAIDAYAQIKRATEVWGPYGSTWKLKDINYHFITDSHLVLIQAVFVYPKGAFEISNSIKFLFSNGKPDDEFAKKAETDLLTKSLSRLGFNADVFLGMFDDNRYVEDLRREKALKAVYEENAEVINLIKESIETEDYQPGAERWFGLDNQLKEWLWVAPSKGGCFTTKERKVMQSTEWREAAQAA